MNAAFRPKTISLMVVVAGCALEPQTAAIFLYPCFALGNRASNAPVH
jgi:hypothetical protein